VRLDAHAGSCCHMATSPMVTLVEWAFSRQQAVALVASVRLDVDASSRCCTAFSFSLGFIPEEASTQGAWRTTTPEGTISRKGRPELSVQAARSKRMIVLMLNDQSTWVVISCESTMSGDMSEHTARCDDELDNGLQQSITS
jgi:hypothetical protein